MTTFRELEALVAAVDMGSFKGAARALNTSQSAVSRLIQEFEAGFAHPLFDRTQRTAKLTVEGQEVLRVARAALRQRATLAERFAQPGIIESMLRLGVTELAASTWLPRFVSQLRTRYPRLNLEVDVDSSPQLHSRVRNGKLDIALVVDSIRTQDMVRIPVGVAEVGWYCAPEISLPAVLTFADLERQTLLIQAATTGAGMRLSAWFLERSIRPASVIHCDSLMAISGMAAAGIGLANLPKSLAREALSRGALKEVSLPLEPPNLNYVALVKVESLTALHSAVITIAQECCDFSIPFHSLPMQSIGEGKAAC